MKDAAPETFYLSDYTPFGWRVVDVNLVFKLSPNATRVISRIRFSPLEQTEAGPLFLHGEKLKLISAKIDGLDISTNVTDIGLTFQAPSSDFTFEAEVEIAPPANTSLEGL